MLFNSQAFLIFFPVVTIIYFLLPHRFRWLHLLISSCVFYCAFIPVYIFILFFTIVVDYIAGIYIERSEGKRRWYFLVMSIMANVGVLAIFKYYNFITMNIDALIHVTHLTTHDLPLLNILLPVGLSFHTFQAMSYTIEVYRGNQKAERHFGIYSLYVMFYPQLVAGPIERPQNLLHQFKELHRFDPLQVQNGLRLMLWGFYKKVVIADRLGLYVNYVYSMPDKFNAVNLIVATVFFAFQIYCDFSGYSDIALGAAQVMGFNLMVNFNRPFISKNVTEFWRRWHISLSTWFNDYLFNPFVIEKREWGKKAVVTGLLLTFIISGVWHGAGWKFVVFGMLHGIAMIYEFLSKKIRLKVSRSIPSLIYNNLSIFLTFCFLVFSWIFFRANTWADAMLIYNKIIHWDMHVPTRIFFIAMDQEFLGSLWYCFVALVLFFLFMIEYFDDVTLRFLGKVFWVDLIFTILVLSLIINLGIFNKSTFIYFAF